MVKLCSGSGQDHCSGVRVLVYGVWKRVGVGVWKRVGVRKRVGVWKCVGVGVHREYYRVRNHLHNVAMETSL